MKVSRAASILVDRSGKPLAPGMHVNVQHCIGPYGQTQIVSGELSKIDEYRGMTIRVDKPTRYDQGRFGVRHLKPGEEMYIASVFSFFSPNTYKGYEKFEDFEHGHESWVVVCE